MQEHFDVPTQNAANFVPLSPVSFLNRAALVHAEDTAAVHGDIRRTWAEVSNRVRRVAGGLIARGIRKGQTVSVIAPNIPELYELHYAVPMCGAVLGAINTRLEAETIAYILEHSDSRMVMVAIEVPWLHVQLDTMTFTEWAILLSNRLFYRG